jgi:cysteine desulfurase family protein
MSHESVIQERSIAGEGLVYLDNAASSWPKPGRVRLAMERALERLGANPGRSAHRLSMEAARSILDARVALAGLFRIDDPLRIVFTRNATEALNMVVRGLLGPGDRVITTGMEHNAVMRPLAAAMKRGVSVEVIPCSGEGLLDPDDVKKALRKRTALVMYIHASNVSGSIMPVAEVGRLARERGALHCVDAAQTAGCLSIDVEAMNIDLLAFTGHKSLYGPQGTGGLYVAPGVEARMEPLIAGGTGSLSESEEQPSFMPDRFEAGTPNTPGIAGLREGVAFVEEKGVGAIRRHEMGLASRLAEGLEGIDGVRIMGPAVQALKVAVVSMVAEGMDPSEISLRLDEEYGVMARPGLQCAPSAHRTLGTCPAGTLRFSPGYFNTVEHVDRAVDAVRTIVTKK